MIQVAIVGTGGMGTVHYSNYQHIKGAQVAALVGITPQSKDCSEKWGVPLFEDIPSMAKVVEVDVVDVCSPTFLHKEHVLQGLAAGKHVITEKPVPTMSHRSDVFMSILYHAEQDRECS